MFGSGDIIRRVRPYCVAMLRHIKYPDVVRHLAVQACELAKARDVLYHGTRYTLVRPRGPGSAE
jgi:hypothetical protein